MLRQISSFDVCLSDSKITMIVLSFVAKQIGFGLFWVEIFKDNFCPMELYWVENLKDYFVLLWAYF